MYFRFVAKASNHLLLLALVYCTNDTSWDPISSLASGGLRIVPESREQLGAITKISLTFSHIDPADLLQRRAIIHYLLALVYCTNDCLWTLISSLASIGGA
jgi:hypothetical protein